MMTSIEIMAEIISAPQAWSGGPKDLRSSKNDPCDIDTQAKILGLPVVVLQNCKTELRGTYNKKHEYDFKMNKMYDEGRV